MSPLRAARLSPLVVGAILCHAPAAAGQGGADDLEALVTRFAAMTAVTGYEQQLADSLLLMVPGSVRDRFGNAVRAADGSPRRLIACALDEPGWVVGGVRPDGWLTLRRTPGPPLPERDRQLEGAPVTVFGRRGPVPGVVAVRSIHLMRQRGALSSGPFTADSALVDVGAASAAEVERMGVGVLAVVTLAKRPHRYGDGLLAAPHAGRRAACAAVAHAAAGSSGAAVAFTVQQELAGRGLAAAARLAGPFEETLLVGAGEDIGPADRPPELGSVRRLSLPVRHGGTPVETVAMADVRALEGEITRWLGSDGETRRLGLPAHGAAPRRRAGDHPPIREAETLLRSLVESYGPSGMEAPVREVIRSALPSWARPEVDSAGNLLLTIGRGDPTVVFVAHMDEVGFRVAAIGEDGTLLVEPLGGLFPSLWEGRPALVHTGAETVPGVFLPRGAEAAESRQPETLRVDPGTGSRSATEARGVRVGHTVTGPKAYTRLAGYRATGRSFDDRIGSAAQILAVRRLDPARLRHTVVFIWSTREEIGLEGARAAARALGTRPARVHAVDTFVSADSPLEPGMFALAPLGRGPVARALDHSSVTPPALLDSLAALARARGIPLQAGATAGGNDGSVFGEYGVPDVPIGWPLRYSHSPVEVADLRDVAGLADLVHAIARDW